MCCVLALAALQVGCSSTVAGDGQLGGGSEAGSVASTASYYWSLDLSTPEAGASAFIDAWTQGDFLLVYQLSDIRLQNEMQRAIAQGAPMPFVIPGAAAGPPLDQDELALAPWWLVQRLTAARNAGLMIVDFTDAEPSGTSRESDYEERQAHDIGVLLAGGGTAELRMVQSESGRWRVVQVGVPSLEAMENPLLQVDTDECGVDPRLELLGSADCGRLGDEITISGMPTEDFERERQRLRDEAGDDINRQIAAGQAVLDLMEGRVVVTNLQLCLVMQGHGVRWNGRAPDLTSVIDQAESLTKTLCPGDPERVTAADLPPPVRLEAGPDDMVAYASLDLDTPQSAVETLLDMTRAGESLHVVLTLDGDAQRYVYRKATGVLDWLSEASWGTLGFTSEQAGYPLGRFDEALRLGLDAGDLRIDLPSVTSVGPPVELGAFGERTGAVMIEAEVPGHDDGVAFVLLQAPSGRWRVRQVASPPSAIDPEAGLFVVVDEVS